MTYAEQMRNGTFNWSSMSKSGQPDPIIIARTAQGEQFLLEGHHRFLAARLVGIDLPATAPGILEYRDFPIWPMGTEWTNIRWR